MEIDPVCHMEVDEEKAPGRTEYKGQTYLLFLCSGVQDGFRKGSQEVCRQGSG